MTFSPPPSHADLFSPEARYLNETSPAHRKRLGQFFTPVPVARFMADWVLANPHCRSILDPGVGPGIFLRAALEAAELRVPLLDLHGCDLDSRVLSFAEAALPPHVQLRHADYLSTGWEERYDGVLCNPPYQKFHDYPNRAATLDTIQSRLNAPLGGQTNIYALFLLKAVHQLAPDGRAAFLVPSEFLNADYGVAIKQYLLQSQTLRHVIVFDSQETLFPEALTTSCLLLLANDNCWHEASFTGNCTVGELPAITAALRAGATTPRARIIPLSQLQPQRKWRHYYDPPTTTYRGLVPLSDYGKVVRGIATGDNDYFTFNDEKRRLFELDERHLLPCLAKAPHAPHAFFTTQHWHELRRVGKNVLLLNATDPADPALQRYLEHGERLGVHRKYLTSHRRPWFALEKRPPAPLLVTVFNRNGLRWVRNEAGASTLTCFHSFYPNLLAHPYLDLLTAYLLTGVAREIMSADRREYGGGLHKFEPNDLNATRVADIARIPAPEAQEVLALYQRYRASTLQEESDGTLLQEIDTRFRCILDAG